jgi:protein-L-isoaspartate(D-aspartate) O-methyltransferase
VPESLRQQLAIPGRLVMPIGQVAGAQRLERITRTAADKFGQESLASVRFVPLVGPC